jgi:hypothetical protein
MMPLDAHKLASLLHSLEGAALALDGSAVDDAAKKQAWSGLSSRAQQMLHAFSAGRAPAASCEPSESAAVTASTRPRTACGIERFPEDVLGAVLAFVDLPMRFTCIVACRSFRDACVRLSPRLEHALVVKRFPLLTTVSNIGTAPRELFRTFDSFKITHGSARSPASTLPLGEYTLLLQLEVGDHGSRAVDGRLGCWRTLEVLYVGIGTLSSETTTATYEFGIPPGVFRRYGESVSTDASTDPDDGFRDGETVAHVGGNHLRAKVVASRRIGGKLQFAKIGQLTASDYHEEGVAFDDDEIPFQRENAALSFLKARHDESSMWEDPFLYLSWRGDGDDGGPTRAEAKIQWHSENNDADGDAMSLQDAARCLEHYVIWGEAP